MKLTQEIRDLIVRCEQEIHAEQMREPSANAQDAFDFLLNHLRAAPPESATVTDAERRYTQSDVMFAIEAAVVACGDQRKLPLEAWVVDYAGILARIAGTQPAGLPNAAGNPAPHDYDDGSEAGESEELIERARRAREGK